MKSEFISLVIPYPAADKSFFPDIEILQKVLQDNFLYYEIIIVDDGLPWLPWDDLLSVCPGIRLLKLVKHYGEQIALTAGLDSAIGDLAIIFDIRTDPADIIPSLVEECLTKKGIIYGIPKNRISKSWIRRIGSEIFHAYCRRVLKLNFQRKATFLMCIHRQALNAFTQIRDRSRILRLYAATLGFPLYNIRYNPKNVQYLYARSLWRDLDIAFDILATASKHPLRWLSFLGLFSALLNFIYGVYIVTIFLFNPGVVAGWTTLSLQQAIMFFVLFVQMAILSEYIGKILWETQNKPLYSFLEEKNSSHLLNLEGQRNIMHQSS